MGMIFRQSGRRLWMLKYYRDGRPIYESSGSSIKDDARDLLRVREGEIAKGGTVVPKAGRLRFDDAVKDVENDYAANQRRSIDDVKRRIRLHLSPAFGGRRMTTITTADVRTYTTERLKAGAKPASVNRELAILKRAFTLALKAGTLLSKPHIPMLEERNARSGFFEREQLDALLPRLPASLRPVMTFAFFTGWRVRSEILPLTWAQVDEQAETIRLDAGTTKNDEGRVFPYGVLAEVRAVIVAQQAKRKALRKRGVICPLVFPSTDGTAQSPFYSEAWRDACRRAGLPGKIPHDFRRTAVRNLVRAGVAEKTAMLLTGHKTRSVFDRYDIVNENDLRAAVSKLADVPVLPVKRRRQR